jgi:hypothetical protein
VNWSSCGWQVLRLAFAPVPKIQEGAQAVIAVFFLVGIISNPNWISGYLPEDVISRLTIASALALCLMFIAAVRLQRRLNVKPLTLEFDEFLSRVRVLSVDDNNSKVEVKLRFRIRNNDTNKGYLEGARLFFLKGRYFGKPKVLGDSFGHDLIQREVDKLLLLLRDGLAVEAKTLTSYYFFTYTFPIGEGRDLVPKDRAHYFRLVIKAFGQPNSTFEITPDWEEVFSADSTSIFPERFKNEIKIIREI